MNNKIAGTAIVALCLFGSVSAQSILSLEYPGGLPLAHSTGTSLGMEGAGTGVVNDYFGMSDNIANIGATTRAVFSGVASLNLVNINDNGANDFLYSALPRLISFAVPVSTLGTFGFSFDERSSTDFDQSTVSGLADTSRLASVGGIKAWQLGWGHAISRLMFVGLSYERLVYSSYTLNRFSTNDPTGGFPLVDTSRYSTGANALRAGILIPIHKFTFGLDGELVFNGPNGTAKFSQTGIVDSQLSIFQNDSSEGFALRLPSSFSVGASYMPSSKWLLACSADMTFWSPYSYVLPININSTSSYTIHNTVSVAAGAQFIPAPTMLMPQYWQIMQYRAGIRYTQLPDGTSSESAFTLGLGIPLLSGGGLLDLDAEFGRRTDSHFSGYQENFLQFSIGLDGGRQWSQNTGVHY